MEAFTNAAIIFVEPDVSSISIPDAIGQQEKISFPAYKHIPSSHPVILPHIAASVQDPDCLMVHAVYHQFPLAYYIIKRTALFCVNAVNGNTVRRLLTVRNRHSVNLCGNVLIKTSPSATLISCIPGKFRTPACQGGSPHAEAEFRTCHVLH